MLYRKNLNAFLVVWVLLMVTAFAILVTGSNNDAPAGGFVLLFLAMGLLLEPLAGANSSPSRVSARFCGYAVCVGATIVIWTTANGGMTLLLHGFQALFSMLWATRAAVATDEQTLAATDPLTLAVALEVLPPTKPREPAEEHQSTSIDIAE